PYLQLAVAVVEADGDAARALRDQLSRVCTIGDGQAAEHDAIDACHQESVVADTTTRLDANGHRTGDGKDGLEVAALASGRVEVDDVQPPGSGGDEALGHGDRVGAVDRLLVEIALPQAYAATTAQVDRRIELHGVSASKR